LGAYDYQHFYRIKWGSFFKNHPDPLNVLALQVPRDLILQLEWERRFLDQTPQERPKYLVILERARDLLQDQSTSYQATVKRLRKFGYEGVLKHVDASSCGSPSWGSYFATVYYQTPLGVDENRVLQLIGDPKLLLRGFQNCLLPLWGFPTNYGTPKAGATKKHVFPKDPTIWALADSILSWIPPVHRS
jgi:hypothetical protein